MEYFTQKNKGLAGANTAVDALGAAQAMPEVEVPKEGDKILLNFHPYGGVSIVDPENPTYFTEKLIEVIVSGEKKMEINIV